MQKSKEEQLAAMPEAHRKEVTLISEVASKIEDLLGERLTDAGLNFHLMLWPRERPNMGVVTHSAETEGEVVAAIGGMILSKCAEERAESEGPSRDLRNAKTPGYA